MDPVIGLDLHIVLIPAPPAPAPIPTPVPLPFVGMVFDPLGMVIGAAISYALSGSPGLVFVNGLPATNCGTEVTNKLTLPHLPAPGVAFAKGLPGNDAELWFGSYDVSFAGAYAVRLGDPALSCSDPVRLPTSVVLAIPKGFPVLVMRPPAPDLMSIAMGFAFKAAFKALGAALRAGARLFRALRRMQRGSSFFRRVSGSMRSGKPGRIRSRWNRVVCFLTGHPVDVATGRVITGQIEASLPGPLPLVVERRYDSSLSWRGGSLGRGWSHSLDQAVWLEPGRIVVRVEDGREIEIDTLGLPQQRLRSGAELFDPDNRLTIRYLGSNTWEVVDDQGVCRRFAPQLVAQAQAPATIARLEEIRSRDEAHRIELTYDEHGRLRWAKDAAGRMVGFVHDHLGRLAELSLPAPSGEGRFVRRRYRYDAAGDLVEVIDALGHSFKYAYATHLLVQETDRTGFSFYFQYDGLGSGARCVDTWGDGGILHHSLTYDPIGRITLVEDTRGGTTAYMMDETGQVVRIINAMGDTVEYAYDDLGRKIQRINGAGEECSWEYDDAGRVLVETRGDTTIETTYGPHGRPDRRTDANGNEWSWRYDRHGRQTGMTDPLGRSRQLAWDRHRPTAKVGLSGVRTHFGYDDDGNMDERTTSGLAVRYSHDALGRRVRELNPRGAKFQRAYDLEDNLVRHQGPAGVVRYERDAEGNPVRVTEPNRTVELGYEGHHWPTTLTVNGERTMTLEHDLEGALVAMRNAADQRYTYALDTAGRVVAETAWDGSTREYTLDGAGRIATLTRASGRTSEYQRDAVGRVVSITHDDGTEQTFTYRPDGLLTETSDGEQTVVLERDALGRVLSDEHGGATVRSIYDRSRRLGLVSSMGATLAYMPRAVGLRQDGDSWVAKVHRDRHRSSVQFPGGVASTWSLDPMRRPVQHTLTRTGRTPVVTRYAWEGRYRLVSAEQLEGRPRQHTYDQRGRLTGIVHPDGRTEGRHPDTCDNMFERSDRADRRYGPAGELVARSGEERRYDPDGRLVERITAEGTWLYHWDACDRLTEVERPQGSPVRFGYDPLGRRLFKDADGVRTDYVWNGRTLLHERRSAGDAPAATWTWIHEPGTFRPLACRDPKGDVASIVTDLTGVPSRAFDEQGRSLWRASFDSFGRGTPDNAAGSNFACPFRLLGQHHDPETGLHYNGYRYYDPAIGTYISRDPLRMSAGLNLYHYPMDPLVWVDPLGLDDCYRADGRDWDAIHAHGGFRPKRAESPEALGDMDSFVRDGTADGFSVSTTRSADSDLSQINDPSASHMYIVDMDHPSMSDRHVTDVGNNSNVHAHENEAVVRHPDWQDSMDQGNSLDGEPAVPWEAVVGRVERADDGSIVPYDGDDAVMRDIGGEQVPIEPRPADAEFAPAEPPAQTADQAAEMDDFLANNPEFSPDYDPDADMFGSSGPGDGGDTDFDGFGSDGDW